MGYSPQAAGAADPARSDADTHIVIATIIDERKPRLVLADTIEDDRPRSPGGPLDPDVVGGVAEAVMHGESGPGGRQMRIDAQASRFQAEAEQRFGEQAVHPPGRS